MEYELHGGSRRDRTREGESWAEWIKVKQDETSYISPEISGIRSDSIITAAESSASSSDLRLSPLYVKGRATNTHTYGSRTTVHPELGYKDPRLCCCRGSAMLRPAVPLSRSGNGKTRSCEHRLSACSIVQFLDLHSAHDSDGICTLWQRLVPSSIAD